MMRYCLLFLLPFLLHATPFKIATYNVENLFDAVYNGTEYDDYMVGQHNWNAKMVEIKLNHTAEILCDLNADIVGLQEIENAAILSQLLLRLEKVGCAYKYSAISTKQGSAIQVALLSRYPIKHQQDLQVSYAPRVRNILEVEVDVEGNALTLFVNHWKSKAYHGYESKRIAYAKTLQERIAKIPAGKEYIILGDLNSDYDTYVTLEHALNDSHGKTALNDVLNTKLGSQLVEESQMPLAQRGVHFSLWPELPYAKRWSHNFFGHKSTIDHIVLPKQMFDGVGVDYVNNSFAVFKAPYLFTKKGYINRWEYKNKKHTGKGYSDHLPLYAMFDVKPYVAEYEKNHSEQAQKKTIEALYEVEQLEYPAQLDGVLVIYKKGHHAIVKQTTSGRGIYLYGCATALEVGHVYDLRVGSIKTYQGLKEITHITVLKDDGMKSIEGYYVGAEALTLQQNEVLSEVAGVYKNNAFYMEDKYIPLYFKNRKLKPKEGTPLKIHLAHIGYYKKLQLVIVDEDDFESLE